MLITPEASSQAPGISNELGWLRIIPGWLSLPLCDYLKDHDKIWQLAQMRSSSGINLSASTLQKERFSNKSYYLQIFRVFQHCLWELSSEKIPIAATSTFLGLAQSCNILLSTPLLFLPPTASNLYKYKIWGLCILFSLLLFWGWGEI